MWSHILAQEIWFLKVKQGRQVQKAQNLQKQFTLFWSPTTQIYQEIKQQVGRGPPTVVESCVRGMPAEMGDWSRASYIQQASSARPRRAGHHTVHGEGSREKSTLEINMAGWIIPSFSMIKSKKLRNNISETEQNKQKCPTYLKNKGNREALRGSSLKTTRGSNQKKILRQILKRKQDRRLLIRNTGQ